MTLVELWPLFGLRITSPRLVLRPPTDNDFEALAKLVADGIHDPAMMPFSVPWTDFDSPYRERQAMQHWWRTRAEFSTDLWSLMLAVELDGEIVGVQDLMAKQFQLLRTAETGSWLGRQHQRQGIGTEMRGAAVSFAFEHLEALAVTSAAFAENIASQKVSEAVGYEQNGSVFAEQRQERGTLIRYRLTRQRWLENDGRTPIEVEGFEPVREIILPDQ